MGCRCTRTSTYIGFRAIAVETIDDKMTRGKDGCGGGRCLEGRSVRGVREITIDSSRHQQDAECAKRGEAQECRVLLPAGDIPGNETCDCSEGEDPTGANPVFSETAIIRGHAGKIAEADCTTLHRNRTGLQSFGTWTMLVLLEDGGWNVRSMRFQPIRRENAGG
jgi:hypothetical protein